MAYQRIDVKANVFIVGHFQRKAELFGEPDIFATPKTKFDIST